MTMPKTNNDQLFLDAFLQNYGIADEKPNSAPLKEEKTPQHAVEPAQLDNSNAAERKNNIEEVLSPAPEPYPFEQKTSTFTQAEVKPIDQFNLDEIKQAEDMLYTNKVGAHDADRNTIYHTTIIDPEPVSPETENNKRLDNLENGFKQVSTDIDLMNSKLDAVLQGIELIQRKGLPEQNATLTQGKDLGEQQAEQTPQPTPEPGNEQIDEQQASSKPAKQKNGNAGRKIFVIICIIILLVAIGLIGYVVLTMLNVVGIGSGGAVI